MSVMRAGYGIFFAYPDNKQSGSKKQQLTEYSKKNCTVKSILKSKKIGGELLLYHINRDLTHSHQGSDKRRMECT